MQSRQPSNVICEQALSLKRLKTEISKIKHFRGGMVGQSISLKEFWRF